MKTYTAYYSYCSWNEDCLTEENFGELYAPVMTLQAESLEEVYNFMQGENWSPNGEAREAIKALGLSHTSMMIDDIIYCHEENKYYNVDWAGFSDTFMELDKIA